MSAKLASLQYSIGFPPKSGIIAIRIATQSLQCARILGGPPQKFCGAEAAVIPVHRLDGSRAGIAGFCDLPHGSAPVDLAVKGEAVHGRAVIVVEMERLDPRAISGQKVPFRVIPVMMPAVVAESHPLGIGQTENGVEIWQVPEVFKGKAYFQPFRPVDDAPDAVQAARRAGQIFAGKMDDQRRDFKGGTVGDTLQVEIFRRLAVERVAPDVVLQRSG